MLSKITAFFVSVFMFFSSIIPGLFKQLGIGNKFFDIATDVGKYVETHLPVFNKLFADMGEAFKATAIEKAIPCTVLLADGTTEEATYIDFNGNFGYMILSKDYYIYAYKSEGDFAQLKGAEKVYYSVTDGFGYIDENGSFVSFGLEGMGADESFTYEYLVEYFKYVSQDGSLKDTDEYVKGQYGDGYELVSEYELGDFDYSTQMSTSVYKEIPKPGWVTSEGNCSLQSIYAMMNYYQKKAGTVTPEKYSALPSSDVKSRIYADRDPFFNEFKDNENYLIEGYNRKTGKCTGFVVPAMYKTIRTFCINNYGYKNGGTNPDNFKYIVENVFNTYNVAPTVLKEHVDLKTFQAVVVPHLKDGLPVLWSMSYSSTYGSHTAVITGYKIYTKTVEVNGFKILTDRIVLLKLNDNWSPNGNYFDYTRYTVATGSFYTLDD